MEHGLNRGAGSGEYGGKRILEAMRGARRYAHEIFRTMTGAIPPGAQRVLDFGAGDGVFLEQFASAGVSIDCVEPDRGFAAGLLPLAGRVVGDAAELPPDTYDFAFAVNVLEHVDDPRGEAAKVLRALRPGGVFFVFTPAFRVLWTSLDAEVGHLRRYTRRSLSEDLTAAGFSVERSAYFDALGFPAALAVRLLEGVGLFRYSPGTIGFYDRAIFPVSRGLDAAFSRLLGKSVIAVARKAG